MKKKVLQSTILLPLLLTLSPNVTHANPLSGNILGYGCIVQAGNYASDVITINNSDLVKAHGVLAPGTTITHVVNFTYDFGVTDTSCLGSKATLSLDTTTLPATSEVSFDSLVLNGGFTNVSIVNNTGSFSLVLTMTTQSQVSMATPFTYTIPFTINAYVTTL